MRSRMSGYVARMTVVLALAVFFLSPPAVCSAFRNLKDGEIPPDFTLKDLSGVEHSLSAEKGKVVVLCFVKGVQDRRQRGNQRVGQGGPGFANKSFAGRGRQPFAPSFDLAAHRVDEGGAGIDQSGARTQDGAVGLRFHRTGVYRE